MWFWVTGSVVPEGAGVLLLLLLLLRVGLGMAEECCALLLLLPDAEEKMYPKRKTGDSSPSFEQIMGSACMPLTRTAILQHFCYTFSHRHFPTIFCNLLRGGR